MIEIGFGAPEAAAGEGRYCLAWSRLRQRGHLRGTREAQGGG
jgi:hypothetical protein